MGKIIACLGAAVWLTGAASAAVEAEAIPMTDGPHGSGRSLGAAWAMSCAPQERLVGLRLHEDGRTIIGVEALCVALERKGRGDLAWAGAPAVAALPERTPRRAVAVAAEDDEASSAHILRVSSAGTRRLSGSRAMLISIPPSPEPNWSRDRARRVTLRTGRAGRDVVCPDGSYARGLRIGTEAGRRGGLAAVQLLCVTASGRVETAGDWAAEVKPKKGRKARVIVATRTECGGGVANPHDGAAVKAVIGTLDESGRVMSLGLTCARSVVPGPVSQAVERARRWLASLTPRAPVGMARVYRGPSWYAGSDVAVCRDGSGRGPCAQASADRFCSTMTGAGRASFYVVGRVSSDAIAAGGKRCPSGVCRAFQQITCSS